MNLETKYVTTKPLAEIKGNITDTGILLDKIITKRLTIPFSRPQIDAQCQPAFA